MSINRLIEDTYKPWLNIRVNDLTVDGDFNIPSTVTPGTYGSSSQTPVITVNDSGTITNVTQTPTFKPTVWALNLSAAFPISSAAPSGVPIIFDTTVLNTPVQYNTTTGIFTIPAGNQGAYRFDFFFSFNIAPGVPINDLVILAFLQQLTGGTTTLKEIELNYATVEDDQRQSEFFSVIVSAPNTLQTYRWVMSQISSVPARDVILDGGGDGRYCQMSITRLT
jgi:hypothetical protein